MKVCLIGPIPPFRGGIAKYCYSLAKELENRDELLLLSYTRQYPEFLYRKSQVDLDIDREKVLHEFKNIAFEIDSVSVGSWIRASKEIAGFGPDVVILPWWVVYWTPMYLYFLYSLKKKGIRVIFICINVFEHEDNALKKLLTKFVLRRVDSIVVHSQQEKAEILEFNPEAAVKKHLLPLFEYDARSLTRDDGNFHLLFFGFVRPYKGLDTLLRAVSLLKNRDIFLKIAGEFWNDKDEYVKLIDELGIADKVEIIDRYVPDDEMSLFFSWADLVVLPYKKSKTSGIIATAYGFRKPVLATDVGGFHEIVRDEYTGRLVPPDDPEAMADGIAWFQAERERDFGGNIARFASRHMSWSSLVDTIEECVHLPARKDRDVSSN